ncbi:membrane protein [Streptomyces showdoensis]|uniref:Membrane protein n=1 Tax=Streptomyces showdoensis TaxID=68268 RepID=A0A2P2GTX0_STREW|nr:membrane protein [Streptomyces showdoensis]
MLIGAAVVLFIASFLSISGCDASAAICDKVDLPNSWEVSPLGWGSFFLGIAGAALVVLSRALPQAQPRKVAGLEFGQVGAAFGIASAWTLLMWVFESENAGAGLILGLIASLVLAGAAVAAPLVPALGGPLLGAPKPQTPQPYGMQPGQQGVPGGYGYPGAQQQPQPYGGQPDPSHGAGQPFGAQPQAQQHQAPQPQAPQPQPQQSAAPAPAADFAPFWFAVPVARPLYAEDGSQAPIAELAPGTWYLAVEQRGQALVAQTQDGRRGVLQDTTGIQRG